MKRRIPVKLLGLLESLFSYCCSCVKWENTWSELFMINFGVRQGSVLSPLMFALYVDDLANLFKLDCECYIILYADDILLIAHSVTKLESMLHTCEQELECVDMSINFKKSCCLRIGSRYNKSCAIITSRAGCARMGARNEISRCMYDQLLFIPLFIRPCKTILL